MFKPARKIYDWAAKKAYSPKAPLWLGLVFLLELVFFLPLDALLMLFCWENPKRRFLYALMATLASVITATLGYLVGYLLWDLVGPYLIGNLISAQFFDKVVQHYNAYEHWAVMLGSLLPIPFKVVTISAGFCQLNPLTFIFCVAIARALRFFAIAEMMNRWGAQIKQFVDRNFNRILMAVGAKIALGFTFFCVLTR